MAQEVYTISTAFVTSGGVIALGVLRTDVDASAITQTLNFVNYSTDTDTCVFDYPLALSAPDKAILDGIVAAHTGVSVAYDAIPTQEQIEALQGSDGNKFVTTNEFDGVKSYLFDKVDSGDGSITLADVDLGFGLVVDFRANFGTAVNTVCEGNDSRLSDARTPTGAASGDLGGTYPGPSVAALTTTSGPTSLTIGAVADGQSLQRSGATIIGATMVGTDELVKVTAADTTASFLNAAISAGTGLSSAVLNPAAAEQLELTVDYGTSSTTACVGDDARLSDSRTPTGAASGDLGSTYPGPTCVALTQPDATRLAMTNVPDTQILTRSGTSIVGTDLGTIDGTVGGTGTVDHFAVWDTGGTDIKNGPIAENNAGDSIIHRKVAEVTNATLPAHAFFRNTSCAANTAPINGFTAAFYGTDGASDTCQVGLLGGSTGSTILTFTANDSSWFANIVTNASSQMTVSASSGILLQGSTGTAIQVPPNADLTPVAFPLNAGIRLIGDSSLPASAADGQLVYDTSNDTLTLRSNGAWRPLSFGDTQSDLLVYDNFILGSVTATSLGAMGWSHTESGPNSALMSAAEAGHPGIARLVAGGTTTAFSSIHLGDSGAGFPYRVGGTNSTLFEAMVNIVGPVDPVDFERVAFGFVTNPDSDGNPTDGVFIEYVSSFSTAFRMTCRASNVQSQSNGTTVVAAGTWYRVGFEVSASSAQLYVNGVAEGSPVTTNIPSSTTGLAVCLRVNAKTISVDQELLVDYVTITQRNDGED